MLNIIHVWQRNGKWKRTDVSASNIPLEIFTYLHIIAKVFLPPQEQVYFKNVLEIYTFPKATQGMSKNIYNCFQ